MPRDSDIPHLGRPTNGPAEARGVEEGAGVSRHERTDPLPPGAAPAGIREIAACLGVSIGTVDRALHDRRGISRGTRTRVLEAARVLGYRPNLAARALKSRRSVTRIGVRLASAADPFAEEVRRGVLDAARMFQAAGAGVVDLPGRGAGDGAAHSEVPSDLDGLIVVAGPGSEPCDAVDAEGRRIPHVLVGASAIGAPGALSTVCVEAATVGGVAAELLGRALSGGGQVLVATGPACGPEAEETLDAFTERLAAWWPSIAVVQAAGGEGGRIESSNVPGVPGVFVAGRDPEEIAAALGETGPDGRVTIVAAELTTALGILIAGGQVAAAIDRRPFQQGEVAFNTLYRFLAGHLTPPPRVRLAPQIVMRANLGLFEAPGRGATERARVRSARG